MRTQHHSLARNAILLIGTFLLCAQVFAQTPFSFVQLCDPQLGRAGYEHDKTMLRLAVRYVNQLQPDLIVFCGDLIDTAKNAQAYADFKEIVSHLDMPAVYAMGNNDVLSEFRSLIGPDYSVFEHLGCSFMVVNTMFWVTNTPGETEAMDAWFVSALQEASQKGNRIIVAGHHPVGTLPVAKQQEVLDLFVQYGVAAYLAGHIHANSVEDYHGIQLVTTAATCYSVGAEPGFRLWHIGATRPYAHEYLNVMDVYANGKDSDEDGLSDAVEDANQNGLMDPGETDPDNADTDGAGLSDGVERTCGVNPLVPDEGVSVPATGFLGLLSMCVALIAVGARRWDRSSVQ